MPGRDRYTTAINCPPSQLHPGALPESHSAVTYIERVFYSAEMQASGGDEQALAQIADVCRWYAVGGPPTAQRQAAALAELAHITGGSTDLLARYAGQSLATHDAGADAAVHERAAQLCITAGADMNLIDRWSRENRHKKTISSG